MSSKDLDALLALLGEVPDTVTATDELDIFAEAVGLKQGNRRTTHHFLYGMYCFWNKGNELITIFKFNKWLRKNFRHVFDRHHYYYYVNMEDLGVTRWEKEQLEELAQKEVQKVKHEKRRKRRLLDKKKQRREEIKQKLQVSSQDCLAKLNKNSTT